MTVSVNPEFAKELEGFGVDTSMTCFNCGTCTAICPLVYEHFPRKIMRYIQLGAKDRLLEDPGELWRCLHCGLCTRTCPRQAEPGEVIQGMKRFVVNHWRNGSHV